MSSSSTSPIEAPVKTQVSSGSMMSNNPQQIDTLPKTGVRKRLAMKRKMRNKGSLLKDPKKVKVTLEGDNTEGGAMVAHCRNNLETLSPELISLIFEIYFEMVKPKTMEIVYRTKRPPPLVIVLRGHRTLYELALRHWYSSAEFRIQSLRSGFWSLRPSAIAMVKHMKIWELYVAALYTRRRS
jgi:hypothetical protein